MKTARENEHHPRKKKTCERYLQQSGKNGHLLVRRRQSRDILFEKVMKKTGVTY